MPIRMHSRDPETHGPWVCVAGLLVLMSGVGTPVRGQGSRATVEIPRTERQPLHRLLATWGSGSPVRLAAGIPLRDQKLTLASTDPLRAEAARRALAVLLQSAWARTDAEPERLVLTRKRAVTEELARRDRERTALENAARREQAALLREQFARALRLADDPPREIEPGTYATPGSPPHAQPLVKLLGSFPVSFRDALFSAGDFSAQEGGLEFPPTPEPVGALRFSQLTGAQQDLVRAHVGARLGGNQDRTDYSRLNVSFWNERGRRIMMGFHAGYRGESPVLFTQRGAAEKALKSAADQPLFAADGPQFVDHLPPELSHLRGRRFRLEWKDLDYGEAIQALSSTLGIPVFADYYSLRNRITLTTPSISGSDLLARIHARFSCWFAWSDGVLLVRRPDWPYLDQREIATEWMDRWRARKLDQVRRLRRFGPDLPLALEMTIRLRDSQLMSLMSGKTTPEEAGLFQGESVLILGDRWLLRVLGALRPDQRKRLVGTGLVGGEVRRSAGPPLDRFVRRSLPWLRGVFSEAAFQLRVRPAPPGSYSPAHTVLTGGGVPLILDVIWQEGQHTRVEEHLAQIPYSPTLSETM